MSCYIIINARFSRATNHVDKHSYA